MFNSAQAAISLTYDDGMTQHLDHAAPDLESHGLRGTFYVPTGSSSDTPWHVRAAEWNALAARGHEIGNHTRTHPCRGRAVNGLQDYNLGQICDQIALAQNELTARLGDAVRSFAYPCCHTTVGPDSAQISYVDFVNTLFPASRIAGDKLADPATLDFGLVPSFIMHEKLPPARMIDLLDKAIATNQWLVLTFHGVGGGHINYPRPDHQSLCHAIADRADKLLCQPFIEIAQKIRESTSQPWG